MWFARNGPRGVILAFHSRNVSGSTYATNDHVALDESLSLLRSLDVPILRLIDVVRRLRDGTFAELPPRFACITFDDGSDYDWKALHHPRAGPQVPMFEILKRHTAREPSRDAALATTFVIASPKARKEIAARTPNLPGEMSEDWWAAAQSSGLLDVGTHGWNHVHPAVSEMAGSPQLVKAFHRIRTQDQADLQVKASVEYIRARAGKGSAMLLAYPYGRASRYLARQYLPGQDQVLGAVTTGGAPVRAGCDVWRIPRYVCGWHWASNDQLARILAGKSARRFAWLSTLRRLLTPRLPRPPRFDPGAATRCADLGQLSLFEVHDAKPLAGPMFRKAFRRTIPRLPRHFVLLHCRGDDDFTTVGYMHYTKRGAAYLAGGLVVSPLEFRNLDASTARLVRAEGGFAEWIIRTTCGLLRDADAVFAHMGMVNSIRVSTRVGFEATKYRHLYVLRKKPLEPAAEQALLADVASVGPF